MNNPFAQALSAAIGRCIATKAVSEDGAVVGFMYREAPLFEEDSGWRFFSGDESDDYTDNAANFTVYSVADISSHTPDIAPLLGQPPGSAWERNDEGDWIAVADWQPRD